MSTKTLRKRIALVAVSAMGFGLLTSVAANAADLVADELIVAPSTVNTANNMCANVTASGVDKAIIPLTSSGLTIQTTTEGSDAGSGMTAYAKVTGPGVIASGGSAWTIGSTTSASATDLDTEANVANSRLTVKPTAVGTITVTLRKSSSTSDAVDTVTIVVVDKCSRYSFSAADSYVAVVSPANALSGGTFATNIDDSSYTTLASAANGYIRMKLKDVYGLTLLSDALIATTKGDNCLVDIDATGATDANYATGLSQSAVMAGTGADHVVSVYQYDSDTPATCVTTVTYAGQTVATKTLTFRGIPAKVTVSDVTVGAVNGSGYYRVTVKDAAGNLLPGVAISASSTETNNAAALLSTVVTNPQATGGAVTSSSAATLGTTTEVKPANFGDSNITKYSCNASKGGTAKLTVRALVSAATATYVTSDPFTVACGGTLATWSVALDKAQYAPGEIATLTLTGKDSNGFPVGTFTALTGVASSFGGMTAVTAPADNDVFSSGIGTKTYQFSVGTTEGAFVGTFKTTGSVDTAAKTLQYKVVAPTTGVTNAEVLAAIVKLIASINQQIAALQKALTKKKK